MGKESWDSMWLQFSLHISRQLTGYSTVVTIIVLSQASDMAVEGFWGSTIKFDIMNITRIPVAQIKQPILTPPEKVMLGPWGKITEPNTQVCNKKPSQQDKCFAVVHINFFYFLLVPTAKNQQCTCIYRKQNPCKIILSSNEVFKLIELCKHM